MKRTSQILEENEDDEEDHDSEYHPEKPLSRIKGRDFKHDNSFDKRKNTDNIDVIPLPIDDFARGLRPSDTPMSIGYYLGGKKDVGQRTMYNWTKKTDRLPTRGIHTRGGRRREK